MKKYYITITVILIIQFVFSQNGNLGINTVEPLQKLHIAGPESKLRLEMFDNINNISNRQEKNAELYVDEAGILTLDFDLFLNTNEISQSDINVTSTSIFQSGVANIDQLLFSKIITISRPAYLEIKFSLSFAVFLDQDENLITDNLAIPNNREIFFQQTGNGENFRLLIPNNYTFQSFTLKQQAIVEINYSVSWRIRRNNDNKVSDRGARSVETAAYIFNNATSSYLPDRYALTGQFYSNGDSQLGAAGFFYNTGSDYVLLNAGTYTIIFGGRVTGGGNDSITIYFGGDNDQLQIVAYY